MCCTLKYVIIEIEENIQMTTGSVLTVPKMECVITQEVSISYDLI